MWLKILTWLHFQPCKRSTTLQLMGRGQMGCSLSHRYPFFFSVGLHWTIFSCLHVTIIHRNTSSLTLKTHTRIRFTGSFDFRLYRVNYLPVRTDTHTHTHTFSGKKSAPAVRSSTTDCRQQLRTDHEKLNVCMRWVHIWNAQRENKAQHQPRLQATNFSEIISLHEAVLFSVFSVSGFQSWEKRLASSEN